MIPILESNPSSVTAIAVTALRATGIEGVDTGMGSVLKEVRTRVDGDVVAGSGNWHVRLLAQAAEPNPGKGRSSILSEPTYDLLDRLRAFRHVERHFLRPPDVDQNLARPTEVFPAFEDDLGVFIRRRR